MNNKYTIAVDAMGGDEAPQCVVDGIKLFIANDKQTQILLFGDEAAVMECFDGSLPDQVTSVHTDVQILNTEDPMKAIRLKADSSLMMAIRAVKDGKADALVSAGNTGAVMTGSLFTIGRRKGIHRPALTPILPSKKGPTVLIDCGANAECKPEHLVQFGLMGSVYSQYVLGVDNPPVGLLNIGSEPSKGNKLYKSVHKMMAEDKRFNFAGNIEARYALDGDIRVLVCDGFTGNIFLKTVEGTAMYMMSIMKQELSASFIRKIGTLLVMKGLKSMKKRLDYTETGGALLLGLENCVVKAHGSSTGKSFSSALVQAKAVLDGDVVGIIKKALAED